MCNLGRSAWQDNSEKLYFSIITSLALPSSLSYLENFPADCLKIDQSFIKHLDQNSHKRKLVPGIINIAQTIGMDVIAEGVENAQHLESLRALNCDFGQGYHFARPLDSQSFLMLIETSPTW